MSYTLKFNNIGQTVSQAAEKAAFLAASHVMDTAVERTPMETGALRGSAKVSTDGTTAAVSYNTVYAARQHEEVGWSHPHGQAKYLESAMISEAEAVKNVVVKAIKGAMG